MGDPKGGAFRAKMMMDIKPRSWYKGSLNVGVHLPLGAMGGKKSYLNNEFWTENQIGNNYTNRLLFKYGPMLNFGIGNSFSIWPGVMDLVIEVYGSHLFEKFSNAKYLSLEANAGIKLYIERSSYLLAGYAHAIPTNGGRSSNPGYGYQSMENRMFIGFAYEPSMGDRDGDGIKDDLDQCPDDPEDRDNFLDSDGCPDPDNDQDGIPDVEDECPLVPEDPDGDMDNDGCPEKGKGDRDGDGIMDVDDKCPDNPEDIDQYKDKDGCPDIDNDGDKILDINDSCPNDPEDIDGFEDENGCPDPDNDKDRIPDVKDSCPNDPETYNGKDDKDGCPDQGDVILEGNAIRIMKKVYFESDSANIKRVSYEILNAVAETIKNNPQLDLIEIGGHADENGKDDYNLKLTADRASSVKSYLLKKGVPANRITAMGYGEYCPVDEEHNEAAWEKNRRVEFKVLISDGRPTGARRGCENAEAHGVRPEPLKLK
jgi:outer membrane protein OmpA-like peptidoglycan-associated protein